jgi:hypothetical protein
MTALLSILDSVIAVLTSAPKGANVILEWSRPVKTKKAYSAMNIVKHVRMVGRVGIEYDNMKAVQEKRASGELPAENAGSWFYHDDTCPGLIRHKRTDAPYVQLFVGTSAKVKPNVSFTVDGIPATMEDIESFILASEKRSEKGETFICKVENMTRIHQEITEEA